MSDKYRWTKKINKKIMKLQLDLYPPNPEADQGNYNKQKTKSTRQWN